MPIGAADNARDKETRLHWAEYALEACELGLFMLGACVFGTLFFGADSPLHSNLRTPLVSRMFMGAAMGSMAIAIILSPMGRRSGAHLNPVVSFTFFCLGKVGWRDALFYAGAQFLGGASGVLLASVLIGPALASPSVRYVVTVPGQFGTAAAFTAECFMGFLTMTVVLRTANHPRLSRITWLFVGLLVSLYIIIFSPVSGFSINPARTVSSAIFARVWTAIWVYFSAPLLGMLTAAFLYVRSRGKDSVYCAKIYHDRSSPCPFRCRHAELGNQ